jgi:hypothetical protein
MAGRYERYAGTPFQASGLVWSAGPLIFLVIGVLLCEVFGGLKVFVLFRRQPLSADLIVIAVQLRFNLFVLIGFVIGWAFCLFRGGKRGFSRNTL